LITLDEFGVLSIGNSITNGSFFVILTYLVMDKENKMGRC